MSEHSPRITTVPAGISFADALAQYVYDQTGGDSLKMAKYTILLPSRRSCRTVRDAFLRLTGGKPMVLPRLQPLGDVEADEISLLFAAQHDAIPDIPPAISALRRQIILAQMVMRLHENTLPDDQRARFDQAAQLAGELAHLLDQVQNEQISFKGLNDLVPEDFQAHWRITLEFLKILTEQWPDILAERGVMDPAARRNLLLQAQSALWQQNPPDTPVIAAGTTASIPATLDLLKVVANLPQGQIILPGLDHTLDDDSWDILGEDHPQFFLKKLLAHLDVKRTHVRTLNITDAGRDNLQEVARLWSETMRPAKTTARWRALLQQPISQDAVNGLSVVECKTLQEEAETIALIARHALQTPDKTIAIVTSDRNLSRRIRGALLRWGIHIDDSAGQPLHRSEKGAFCLAIIDMIIQDFAPIPLLKLFKHPYMRMRYDKKTWHNLVSTLEIAALRGPRPKAGIEGIRARLRAAEQGGAHRPPMDIPAELYDMLDKLQTICHPLTDVRDDNVQSFSSLIAKHIPVIETLATTPDQDGASRLWIDEDGESLSSFLTELSKLANDIPDCRLEEYGLTLRQFMAEQTVRPRYGTHPRVSLLGQIESRLYVADTVIVAGLNEGRWPPEHRHDPWMSRQMRHDFGLPATAQTIGIAAHDFIQLASGQNVILSRAERDGGEPTVPSRWLLRLNTVLKASGLEVNVRTADHYRIWAQKLDKPEQIRSLPRPAVCPPVSARPHQLSVTAIERLMRDPYEIYAKNILRLRKLDPIDADPAAAERGQLLHYILEKFVSAYPDDLPPNAVEILINLGRAEFDALAIPPEIENFWWPRFKKLAHDYLDFERSWREKSTPFGTELKGHYELNDDKIKFTLTAIADRIDRVKENNKAAIIDYKTGSAPSQRDVTLGFSPQLWLEAVMVEEGAFADIGPVQVDYAGFWIVSGSQNDKINQEMKAENGIPSKIAETREGFYNLIRHFMDADHAYIARPNNNFVPRYSDYTHFERVEEWRFDPDLQLKKVGDHGS